ncbi:MAG: glycosyl hydrolase, partial [Saprospiraceae bacterium]|nr:glycosyl hydrolase [Saprospiraceae bacterium]
HGELNTRLGHYQQAILDMPAAPKDVLKKSYDLKNQLNQLGLQLNGDVTRARREFETSPSLNDRVGLIIYGMWNSTSAPTQTFEENYRIAVKQFNPLLEALKTLERELDVLGRQLEQSGAPSTPGRWPERI